MTSNPKNIRELRDEPGISHLDALDARSVEIHQLMCEYLDGDLTLSELLDSVEAVVEFGSKQPQLPWAWTPRAKPGDPTYEDDGLSF